MSQHLRVLAAVATASTERGSMGSDWILLALQQNLRLREVHVCRVEDPDRRRHIQYLDRRESGPVCGLPAPRWQQPQSPVETKTGWVAGFVISGHPGQAVLHLVFDRPPDADDLAAGVVAAALFDRLLPTDRDDTEADPVTGLHGRAALERQLLDGFTKADRTVSLIFADVNGLKAVNDRFGHRAGDRLLRRVAGILADVAAQLGPDTLAARIGGDEFAIAATGVAVQDMEAAIARIDAAASELGSGTGLARGYARLDGAAPGSQTPDVAAHGLLALADAQLYAHKNSLPGREHAPRTQSTMARSNQVVLANLEVELQGINTVENRLARVAQLIAGRANAAAWWLSRQVGDTVVDARCERTREKPLHWDEPERPVVLEPKAYHLDDFATTRLALAGVPFEATLTTGDEVERSILAYFGYRSVIGVGGSDGNGSGWLVEIYGDALTDDLPAWSASLRTAVNAALDDTG